MKKFLMKWILYPFYLLLVVALLMELILHIYNPFSFRQKGMTIVVPRNRKMIFTNTRIPVLEKRIVHTKNSLGFRGPEMPADFGDRLSMIAVGGSTTECFFINDSSCWTAVLARELSKDFSKIWVDNAGYQGHSTFGHFILINDYIKYLHPRYVLLLVGCNEINRYDIARDESVAGSGSTHSAWGWLKRNSELIALALNIQRKLLADRLHVTDNYLDPKSPANRFFSLSGRQIDSALSAQKPILWASRKRLEKILDTCQQNGMHPVLITQPSLLGKGRDPLTQMDLVNFQAGPGYNGLLAWKLQEQYNDVTRSVAAQKHLLLVDLAHEMPGSTLYFYDPIHFTNQGCAKVADILAPRLDSLLRQECPGFIIK